MSHVKQNGFTLIELLVTMVIALIILGGLMVSFTQQNSEYSYQNKRIDTSQNLEFAMKFMANDFRGGIVKGPSPVSTVEPNPSENAFFIGTAGSNVFTIWLWDSGLTDSSGAVDPSTNMAERKYAWNSNTQSLRYDRMTNTMTTGGGIVARTDSTGTISNEILDNVTFFKVFRDDVDLPSRAAFTGIPVPIPAIKVNNSTNSTILSPAYTILIELAIDTGTKNGSFLDVKGVDVRTTADKRKRIWRYFQAHPGTAIQ